ncbi:TMV resistance protein N-like [Cryptomeria japonica]|uniref:TMV resistance protein N-like n=1 Tax=Cryptomeria japonica TaxID=3369 RepID=UPI0027DA99D5|nr:TMV resistance protein N-like [Cryptomeria japonica]
MGLSSSRQLEIENTINAFDGLAPSFPPPSATSSSSLQRLPYDVFINHRGPDVKHKLATHIYNAIHALGLKVFLDSNDLHLGDIFTIELQEAMSSASLHIAIFSPTYARSPWCLAELCFMLKTGTPIIPIFYQVQPEDVCHLKGTYAAAFLEHEAKGRYRKDQLLEWKMALHNVSFYKGESVNNSEEEQRVLKNVVNRVVEKMKIVPLEVAKHPVGLEEVVADFEMTVNEFAKNHPDNQIVGIWGMGVSGKTTLAKELYNKKCSSIEKSSFLFDIRNVASKNKLHKMQRQLLQDFGFFIDPPFNNIEQGKKILYNYLRSVPVFIILDDVDHTNQLEALLPAKTSLASGSLIIVTTRDKEVLRLWGISCIYEMKSMNQSHAKQLFCWHAFLQSFPLLGFEDLVEKFISASNGLPLSLMVLGGQLYGCSSKDLWKDVLHKISRILPDDIINRLRVSYDALDKEEKQMFLDIACFFIGEDKKTAIAVWEGSGWSGLWGWERLVNKCLVDLVHGYKIRMHDHLRDLGREIASSLPPYRLWSPDQFTIRGMILNESSDDVHKFPGSSLNKGPFPYGLKVFVVGESYRNYLHIAKLSTELVWLRCTRITHRNLPSWMSLKNLRVLELDDCPNVIGLWKDGVEAPVQLRRLIISSCPTLKIIPRSIGYLMNLKEISLLSCNVRSLPKEFCHLQSLEHLRLKDCKRLSSLPSCFGHLKVLRHLDLSRCVALEMLPNSCKQLTLLEHLNLEFCEELTLESDILENMTKLEYLNLNYCMQLEELPFHITNQTSLRELYLNNTSLRRLPIDIGQLDKLRVMEIGPYEGWFEMQYLPDSMGNLTLLERLALKNLEVQSFQKSLKKLINLQSLEIQKCPISEFTPLWINLKKIHLDSIRVSKISISDSCCPSLERLGLYNIDQLMEVDSLPKTMEDISIMFCRLLKNISGIGGLVNLRRLYITGCPELETLPSFDKLASLKVFRLENVNKIVMIQGFQNCTSLEMLRLECKCWEVSSIESWEHVQRLRWLRLLAKKRSAVERCIQTIQKWPEEIIICTRAVTGAGSLLNSSAFPNICVVDSISNKELGVDLCNSSSDGNAVMLCLVINCFSPSMRLGISGKESSIIFMADVEEGKWTLIGLFTKHSKCLAELKFRIYKLEGPGNEVEKGMVVRGEEESMVDAFHRLLTLLAS